MDPNADMSVEEINDRKEKRDAFRDELGAILVFGIETKKLLKKKNLRRGHRKCPLCGGTVRAALVGQRDHLRVACENGSCHMRMME